MELLQELYVEAQIGRRFIEPPPFNLKACYEDSTIINPLVFVLSTGSGSLRAICRPSLGLASGLRISSPQPSQTRPTD